MLTNYLFKDLYDDRWGDPANPNAVDPPSSGDNRGAGGKGILSRVAGLFRRRRARPSAWSFTIPSETSDTEGEPEIRHRICDEDPKFLAIAKALSRNC
ncbi:MULTISPECIES: hypothetical protein [unclassified Rhizobium]|uniref:hypothetical protein n=1 Tax=unclassified Rhizobium TaxID=2613769 RepID=UPI000EA94B31|nr:MULTISPECIES: hypothetical protein [unclassified Rhizobium]AYG64807.1 hypothetical protein CCGE531_01465 [Rhizobium sp. CCGE531]AYG71289.1 hypothetical protein CCGE532_01455 [Rhizobium sp. CCGE532]